ncbi:MAG: exodeoxyribonuclease VII small subunit [Bacillota bacterium]
MAKKKMTFEESIKRLEEIVRELEDGQIPLERALDLFSEGITVSKFCQASLEEAERRIMILTSDDEGRLSAKVMAP